MVILLSLGTCRSAILNDVAASSARNRTQVTKTLLVLGESDKNVKTTGLSVCVMLVCE